jgi:tetratricopeptide (TPR) repeat protein
MVRCGDCGGSAQCRTLACKEDPKQNGLYEEYLSAVAFYGSQNWSYAAILYRARLLEQFARTIYAAPRPADMSDEEVDPYEAFLEQLGAKFQNRAIKSLEAALQDAEGKGVVNNWVTELRAEMHKYKPREYTMIREMSRLDLNPSGTLLEPEVGPDSIAMGANHEDLAKIHNRLLRAISRQPNLVSAWFNLALCEYRLGGLEAALVAAKKALEFSRGSSRASTLLSVLYLRSRRPLLAVKMLEDELAKRPRDVMLLGAKGRVLVASGEYDQAIETCVQALRLDPSNPEVMRYLAEAYLGIGRIGLARLALERAYEVYKGDEVKAAISGADSSGPARKQYDLRLAQGGGSWRGVGAEATSREAGLAHIHYLWGRLYMGDGEWESARDQFRRATQLRADYTEAWNNLAVCWIVARKGDEAVEAANKALDLQPTWIEARVNLGSAWRVTRDPEKVRKARAAYDVALKQDPRRAEVHFNLGILYLESEVEGVAGREAHLQKAVQHLTAYREIRGAAKDSDDPIERYLAEAKLLLETEKAKRPFAPLTN